MPVGDDQAQHLELTRDLAQRFNTRFGDEFPLPETITPKIGARIMSLTDPHLENVKSDPSDRSRILIKDSPDQIAKKVKAAVTYPGTDLTYDWEAKPGISNLLELFSVLARRPIPELVEEYANTGVWGLRGGGCRGDCRGLGPDSGEIREP